MTLPFSTVSGHAPYPSYIVDKSLSSFSARIFSATTTICFLIAAAVFAFGDEQASPSEKIFG